MVPISGIPLSVVVAVSGTCSPSQVVIKRLLDRYNDITPQRARSSRVARTGGLIIGDGLTAAGIHVKMIRTPPFRGELVCLPGH